MANAIVATETRTPSICNKQLAASDKVAPVVTTSSIRRICFLIKKDGLTIQGAKKKLKSKDISEDENLAIIKKLSKIKEELKSLKKIL